MEGRERGGPPSYCRTRAPQSFATPLSCAPPECCANYCRHQRSSGSNDAGVTCMS